MMRVLLEAAVRTSSDEVAGETELVGFIDG
jgi:hypothetical protein